MSISHSSSKDRGDRAACGRDAFETRDFYLACFLRCSGYELRGLRAEGLEGFSSSRTVQPDAKISSHTTARPLACVHWHSLRQSKT